MNKMRWTILCAMLAAIIVMPLLGYHPLSLNVLAPLGVLTVGFVVCGPKRRKV